MVLAVMTIVVVLAGCSGGGLSGSYKSDAGMASTTYTFSGTDKVTISAGGGMLNMDGTYKINGDTMSLTVTVLGQESTQSVSFKKDGKNIVIDGVTYVKQ